MLTPEQIADTVTEYPGTHWIDYRVYSPNKEQVRAIVIDAVKLARQDPKPEGARK